MKPIDYIDKRLNESIIAYHGSNKRFKSFKQNVKPVNDDGYMGAGSYFIEDMNHAKQYALMATDNKGGIPILYTVQLYLNKTFIIDNKNHTQNMTRDQTIRWTNILIDKGYDSSSNGHGEYCVFDPSKIKIIKVEKIEDK